MLLAIAIYHNQNNIERKTYSKNYSLPDGFHGITIWILLTLSTLSKVVLLLLFPRVLEKEYSKNACNFLSKQ